MTLPTPAETEFMYLTKSTAGHVLEDALANNPPAGEPFDWYEDLLQEAIDGEMAVSGTLPNPARLARAITANYVYIFKSKERPTPLELAEQLLIVMQREGL